MNITTTPYIIEMEERKALLNMIIMDAETNPIIDTERVLDLFQYMNAELEIYKYSAKVERFQAKLTNELSTDIGGFKAFLETHIPTNNINIYQYLMFKIK